MDGKKKRRLAEDLFINGGLTAKEIAGMVDVTEQTVSRWRKDSEWDEQKESINSAPHKIKQLLLKEIQKLSNGEESNVKADAIVKLANAVEKLDKKINVQTTLSVFKEFDNWLAEIDPHQAVKFTEFHKRFIQHKAEEGE